MNVNVFPIGNGGRWWFDDSPWFNPQNNHQLKQIQEITIEPPRTLRKAKSIRRQSKVIWQHDHVWLHLVSKVPQM